jgi:multidrug efflux pump subunit AcrB
MRRDQDQQPTPGRHRVHLGQMLLATCQLPVHDVAEAGKGQNVSASAGLLDGEHKPTHIALKVVRF